MEWEEYYRSVKLSLGKLESVQISPSDNIPPIPLWATQYLYTIIRTLLSINDR